MRQQAPPPYVRQGAILFKPLALIETQYVVLRDNDVLRAVAAILKDHGLTPTPPK